MCYLHNKKGKTNKKLEYIKLHKDCYLAIKCNLMIAKIQCIDNMDNGRWKSVIKIVFFAPYPDILPVIEQVFRERPESEAIRY